MRVFYCLYFLIILFNECFGVEYMTCGSVFKLKNERYNIRLYSSHEITYGTGSRMQSVTGVEEVANGDSYWLIKNRTGENCPRGLPIVCGQIVRLEHLTSSTNLHSHHFPSSISSGQEIAAFGKDGQGDSGDNWRLECDSDLWYRDQKVAFFHVDTSVYLSASGHRYDQPIENQMVIVGIKKKDSTTRWKSTDGIFIHNDPIQSNKQPHTEL